MNRISYFKDCFTSLAMTIKNKFSHLVLIRHGESVWNAQGKWQGWRDIPLTDKGRNEAKLAASELTDIKFDIAFTSDLIRAKETMEIIKKELNCNDLPTIIEPGFKERNYGIYTGKVKWEIKEMLGEEEFKRLRRGWDVPIPEGESLKDVYDRAVPKYLELILPEVKNGLNILLVAHGNSNRVLIKYIEKIPDNLISTLEIATGEVMIYILDKYGKILSKEKRVVNKNIGKQ